MRSLSMISINSFNNSPMKKVIYLAAVLLAAACQKEALAPSLEGDTNVSFTIEIPVSEQTKATTVDMSAAAQTDIVYYEIWDSQWNKKLTKEVRSAEVKSGLASVDLKLVSGQTYNFVFWAQNKDCGAYDATDLQRVKINYSVIGDVKNNDKDVFDAFYAIDELTVVKGQKNEKTITLKRPFAQLNFGALDEHMTTTFGKVDLGASTITVSELATVFNAIKGEGENSVKEVSFNANGLATAEKLVVKDVEYNWLVMDYMLMMKSSDVVSVEASFNVGMEAPVEHSIPSVPLKKNYRTNIIGDLFTAGATLEIKIDHAFAGEDNVTI